MSYSYKNSILEIGSETGIVKKSPLDCTDTQIFPKFAHSACTGTHGFHFYEGQSESVLKRRSRTGLNPQSYYYNSKTRNPTLKSKTRTSNLKSQHPNTLDPIPYTPYQPRILHY